VREPDFIINNNYLQRWHGIKSKYFNIYLHRFTGSDYDRALHDHPWWSISILIRGELIEHSFNRKRIIPRFVPVIRSAKRAHRIELVQGPAWTIFITGPKIRSWGFHTKEGWIPWRQFLYGHSTPVQKREEK